MAHASVGVEGAKSFNETYKSFFFSNSLNISFIVLLYTTIIHNHMAYIQHSRTDEK